MFHFLFYQPLYNALVFLSTLVPNGDIGLAIVLLTILVKVVLFPLFQKATETQMAIKQIEPQMAELKEKYKDDQETQAKKILELYRTNKINPLTSIGALFVQIPIILALFLVFKGNFVFEAKELYSFISLPASISLYFLGLINITSKSLILALLAGVTQYIQTALTLPKIKTKEAAGKNFKDDFARSMSLNMRYFMPVLVGYIAWSLSSAIALYWITSNVFAIGQEYYLRKTRKSF